MTAKILSAEAVRSSYTLQTSTRGSVPCRRGTYLVDGSLPVDGYGLSVRLDFQHRKSVVLHLCVLRENSHKSVRVCVCVSHAYINSHTQTNSQSSCRSRTPRRARTFCLDFLVSRSH